MPQAARHSRCAPAPDLCEFQRAVDRLGPRVRPRSGSTATGTEIAKAAGSLMVSPSHSVDPVTIANRGGSQPCHRRRPRPAPLHSRQRRGGIRGLRDPRLSDQPRRPLRPKGVRGHRRNRTVRRCLRSLYLRPPGRVHRCRECGRTLTLAGTVLSVGSSKQATRRRNLR